MVGGGLEVRLLMLLLLLVVVLLLLLLLGGGRGRRRWVILHSSHRSAREKIVEKNGLNKCETSFSSFYIGVVVWK